MQGFTHFLPSSVELVGVAPRSIRLEAFSKEKMTVGVSECVQVQHQLDDGFVKPDLGILVVLTELLGNKDGLALDGNVTRFQVAKFPWSDQCVILHKASQIEVFVLFFEI